MRTLKFAAMAAVTVAASEAFCGLFTPFTLDSAAVMPKGVRNLRIQGFTTEIMDKHGPGGYTIPAGDGFNKRVSLGELVDSQPGGFDRGQFKGGLEGLGVKMTDTAGFAKGIVNARLSSTVPVFAYGLTETVTLGVGVPVVYTNVHVSTGWDVDPGFQKTLNTLAANGLSNKVLSYKGQLENVVRTRLQNYGYKELANESKTEIGDVTLGGKYQFYKDMRWAMALAPKIVLPTGRTADVDKIVDIAPGEGQFDAGLAAVADYSPTANIVLTGSLSYLYQLPTMKAKRIPTAAGETATPDVDGSVREKLGNVTGVGLGIKYKLHELLTLGTGANFYHKDTDTYSGSTYSSERYDYLSYETEQRMVSAQAGLTFSTIPWFRANQFALPLDATLNIATVLAGQNVPRANLVSFDLAAYF